MPTAPEPQSVGAVLARLAASAGEASLLELVALEPSEPKLDPSTLREVLDWLEAALLVERVAPERWRLTPNLAETQIGGATRIGQGGVEDDLEIVAAWGEANVALHDAVRAIVVASNGGDLPGDVREAINRLRKVTGGLRGARFKLDLAFDALERHNYGDYEIFERRKLAAAAPPTLETLARELHITRERVRQLESRFEKHLGSSVVQNPDSPIRIAAHQLAAALGPAARASSIADAVATLGPNASALSSLPARLRLLLRLGGPYRSKGRWLVRDGFDSEADSAIQQLRAENEFPLLENVTSAFVSLGMTDRDVEDWLADEPGLRIYEDRVISLGPSLADRGVALLVVRGEAMTLEDLFSELGENRSIRSFKGQMQGDARVRRVGLKTYGLAAWGDEEYTSIVAEMRAAVQDAGGALPIEQLAKELAEKFGVSEASVRMYAAAPPFYLDTTGRVAVGDNAHNSPATKALELTRSCFLLPTGWAYRKRVDADVMRGSGTAIPPGFARELGLEVGETTQLATPLGPLSCGWGGLTAYVGSLRKAAEDLGASEGDYLFIVATGLRSASIHIVNAVASEAYVGYERLAIECGLTGGSAEQIARALGIDVQCAGDATPAISARLRERGESSLLAYLPTTADDGEPEDLLDALMEL